MNIFEIKKELDFLITAKTILSKYNINTSSIDKRINICIKQLKFLEEL